MTRIKTVLITCTAAAAIIGAVGLAQLSNRLGYKRGWQDAQIAVQKAISSADYPTVYLTYPGKMPVAIFRDGYCTPYPATLPPFYHHVFVSPRYEPCAGQHYMKPTAESPALAAITKEIQK